MKTRVGVRHPGNQLAVGGLVAHFHQLGIFHWLYLQRVHETFDDGRAPPLLGIHFHLGRGPVRGGGD
jgi:hypothetical protein